MLRLLMWILSIPLLIWDIATTYIITFWYNIKEWWLWTSMYDESKPYISNFNPYSKDEKENKIKPKDNNVSDNRDRELRQEEITLKG